jgi:hypothetical protein
VAILFYPELFKQHGTWWNSMQYSAVFTAGNLFPPKLCFCISAWIPWEVPKHFGFKISQMLDLIVWTTVNVTFCYNSHSTGQPVISTSEVDIMMQEHGKYV